MGARYDLERVSAGFREGRRVALARMISLVEDEREGFQDVLHDVLSRPPAAKRLGLTGPPGAGKSSLVAALAAAYRSAEESVGVVAVDPTSPFTGGALLGDRIRMNDLAGDPGIFIRSMATRGSLGGLATTTREVMDVMDAFGFERLLVETVGVGQTELEITGAADTVVVVLVPESGDAIQAMKAGLMEIADVFVVNKADRPGADRLVRDLRTSIQLKVGDAGQNVPAHHGVDLSRVRAKGRGSGEPAAEAEREGPTAWRIPVLKTVAQTGEGVDLLRQAVEQHRDHLVASGQLETRRRERAERRIRDVVERRLKRRVWTDPAVESELADGAAAVTRGTETPYSVAARVLELASDAGGVKR